jgi:hypothetical protein
MRHTPQGRSSVAKVAENGEQNNLEMFGAIGLTRGLPQTTAKSDTVRTGELGKTEFGLPEEPLALTLARSLPVLGRFTKGNGLGHRVKITPNTGRQGLSASEFCGSWAVGGRPSVGVSGPSVAFTEGILSLVVPRAQRSGLPQRPVSVSGVIPALFLALFSRYSFVSPRFLWRAARLGSWGSPHGQPGDFSQVAFNPLWGPC